MRIRFLQTVASGSPEFPFMAGQIIAVDSPGPELLELLDGVRAVAVPDVEPEMAVARAPRRKATTSTD